MKPIQKKVLFLLISLIYLILYEILQLTKNNYFEIQDMIGGEFG